MELYEYFAAVQQAIKDNPQWRVGQTHVNVLRRIKPELSDLIRGTARDPFYVDGSLPAFIEWVKENWSI